MSNLYSRLRSISKAPPEPKQPLQAVSARKEARFDAGTLPAFTPQGMAALCRSAGVEPVPMDRLLFLDTETTGLSGGAGTVAFLVGLGYYSGGSFVVEQLWMRGYEEEAHLLEELTARLQGKTVVSFNGSVFDLPLLAGRYVMQRMRMPECPQIDLLKHARAIFRLRLGSVKLTRLEEILLGEVREDDVPGAMVPQLYFDFLKTGQEDLLAGVFEHNVADIVSLTKLLDLIARAYEAPTSLGDDRDVFSLGRSHERKGRTGDAEQCYRLSVKGYRVASLRALGNLYKRQKRMAEAVEGFLSIANEDVHASIELAKYYEHVEKDFQRALMHTDRALVLETDEANIEQIARRRARLNHKQNKE